MNLEILDSPLQFHLHGIGGQVDNERFGEVGMQLMNEMWSVVKENKVPNTGINHWVYLPGGKMFVGVQLKDPQPTPLPGQLQPLDFTLARYVKHVHIGPYQLLPQTWKALKAELAARSETIGSPSLEIYGHHCDDPSKLETTILIGLQGKRA
jgi:hypothetical protein